jgi:hypothetical protein
MQRTAFPKSPLEYLAMKKSILYWAIPIVYIGVIGLFIYLQFSSVDPFSDKIGSITISGTKTSGTFGRTPQIRELTVQYRGLRFTFSGDTPFAVQRDENKPRNLALMEYNRYAAGVELVFEEGVKAAFELGGALGEWMSLRVTLKDGSMCLLPSPRLAFRFSRLQAMMIVIISHCLPVRGSMTKTHTFTSRPRRTEARGSSSSKRRTRRWVTPTSSGLFKPEPPKAGRSTRFRFRSISIEPIGDGIKSDM